MKQRTHRQQQIIYLIADIISSLCIWFSFLVFRWMVYEGRIFGVDEILIPAFNFYLPLILYPAGCILVYYASGYYVRPFHKSLYNELATTFISAIIISFAAFFFIIINDKVDSYHRYLYSLVVLFALQFFISYFPRLIITLISQARSRNGYLARQTIIVGNGTVAAKVAEELKLSKGEYNLLAHIPNLDDNQWQKLNPDTIILAYDEETSEQQLYKSINQLYPLGINICYTPRLFDVLTGTIRINRLDATPIVEITDNHAPDYVLSIKRLFDITMAALALAILSPLLLCVAVAVRLSSPGPVIYKQERIGHFGRVFNIYKFRTMYDNAENHTPQLTTNNDPRITPIGAYLRKYRIDELPQLWNVLKGNMSIVGPRPERQYFIQQIMQKAPYYCLIYKLRPGLTSWGPIKVGYTDTIEKMIQRTNYDIIYMENLSLRLDIKIMMRTIGVILGGKGQ